MGEAQDLTKGQLLDPLLVHPPVTSPRLSLEDVEIIISSGLMFGRLAHVNHIFTLVVEAIQTGYL